ncbi:hypothetical protein FYJ43_01355 [Cutibacterium sp. WCA-380-WT-3A]|uniref:DUF3592 domain-containing protein n=1 Tax=Cutibacterium porci TaxID=2605781 RepID=A0A7K0J462_9ACTN|nr:hypothetical protein [Cutibacterium porci]MSS44730.1 hypothetical protein [Cutibacterium porci]
MLFAVAKFKRVMALLGVIYLATVGCLYLALADRSDTFIRDGHVIQGTVEAVYYHHPVSTGATRYLTHAEGGNVALISYSYNGVSAKTTSNPYRDAKKYHVGQKVDLVIQAAPNQPHGTIVTVRDHTILGMHVIPWGFLASAVVMAAWFGRDYLTSRRRRRAVSHRRTPSVVEG